MSELSILNVGSGDTKLSFDPQKPVERERACKIVTEMLRRGYAIMVQIGEDDGEPRYRRAHGFDPTTAEYLIMGLSAEEEEDIDARLSGKRKKKAVRRVPAEGTQAVAVARSARGCARVPW